MPRPRAPYQTDELELVKSKLPSILTMKPGDVSTWVRNYSSEIKALAGVFNLVASQLHHKWLDAVLARVPVSAWVRHPLEMSHIEPSRVTSMRYLAREVLGADAVDARKQVDTRRILFEELLKRMLPSYRHAYRQMLRWVPYDKLGDPNVAQYPLSSETAFGHNLVMLESLMASQLSVYEQDWRNASNWPKSESTPFKLTRAYSEMALEHLTNLVDKWCRDSATLDGVPDSLLARVSANLSVNRALLEHAAIEARGREARCMNQQFLHELNRQGVLEVPIEMDCGLDEGEHELRKLLTCWFGHDGSMLKPGSFFQRVMNRSDIEMVMVWSRELQETYIQVRGSMGGSEVANESHCSPSNRFMFAMTMVGAFYCKTKTAYEFTGHSNSTYAVFPDRGEAASGNRDTPPTHASHFLMHAYGQIFFANSGWSLLAERVSEYAETASIKRSHVQQLLDFAVKGRTSRELLTLYQKLQQYR